MPRIALVLSCALLVVSAPSTAPAEPRLGDPALAQAPVLAQAPASPPPTDSADAESAEALARRLADAGELDAAAEMFERALLLRERESGPDAPETLALLDAYADVLLESRRFAEAEAVARRAFEIRDRTPLPDASSTWPSLARIAAALRHQGRLDEAESVQRELIARLDAALGPNSSTALATRVGLSGILTAQQRFEDAISLLEQTLATADHALGPDHPQTMFAANTLGLLLQDLDRSSEADPLLRRVLAYRERARGERHPETLTALHFLAFNERLLGRFASAEALYLRALRGWEEVAGRNAVPTLRTVNNYGRLLVEMGRLEEAGEQYRRAYAGLSAALGADARITLVVLANLAQLAERQGDIGLAEERIRDVLTVRERAFGPDDSDTLTALHGLGGILAEQGRYGEAEIAYRRALEGRERVLGPLHRETLATVNDLANLHSQQRRFDEAEALYLRALEGKEHALGPEHPDTLTTIHNLAFLLQQRGRLEESSVLHERALAGREQVLGPDHSLTLVTVGNLASLRSRQERYDEAEALFLRALRGHRDRLGFAHPHTLSTVNNLANLYMQRGRPTEAERLLGEAVTMAHDAFQGRPAEDVVMRANLAVVLWGLDRPDEALRQLRTVDDRLSRWLGRELRTTPTEAERRKVLEAVGAYFDAAFSFALQHPTSETSAFAFDLMLRWKKRVALDDAILNNIARESGDPALLPAIEAVRRGRAALSAAVSDPDRSEQDRERLAEQLDAAEATLRARSERYARFQDASSARTDEVRRALAPDEALVELRVYRPIDLDSPGGQPARLLAGVLRADGAPTLVDLGEFAILHDLQREKMAAAGPDGERDALPALSRALYDRLVARLEPHLEGVERLHLAPDAALNALPFAALADDSGRLVIERYDLRILHTGRDLVVRDRPATARGLVAVGDVDYGPLPDRAGVQAASLQAIDLPRAPDTRAALGALRSGRLGGFRALTYSGAEVEAISTVYARFRSTEPPPTVLRGANARERAVKTLASPPRVLHFATHGYYLDERLVPGRPLLQSGITLAGANRGIVGESDPDGENGILHAVEAQTLNLYGTELVVLSACETGQGAVDYSDGLQGLPLALYVAGAKNVLVALWAIDDLLAQRFMAAYYRHWLTQPAGTSDPGRALQDTQLEFARSDDPALADPAVWSAFVLFEG